MGCVCGVECSNRVAKCGKRVCTNDHRTILCTIGVHVYSALNVLVCREKRGCAWGDVCEGGVRCPSGSTYDVSTYMRGVHVGEIDECETKCGYCVQHTHRALRRGGASVG